MPSYFDRCNETKDQLLFEVKRVVRYLFVGGSAFAIDFGILWFLVSECKVSAWIGAIAAFAISTIFAFLTQMRFTFRTSPLMYQAVWKYAALLFFNMIFTAVIVHLFDRLLGLYLIGKIVATAITTLWNYFLMKQWVFAAPKKNT